ncbi:bZIP transcription factor [Hirsutella rhossiliensis]
MNGITNEMTVDNELSLPGWDDSDNLFDSLFDSAQERYQSSKVSTRDRVSHDAQQPKRKGGRKPIYATSEERKQRNRRAQAAFRERRTEYIKQLEETLRVQESSLPKLQTVHQTAAKECRMLQYKNSLLECILLEKGIDVQAELYAKTDSPNLGLTQIPVDLVQPAPIQSATINRHRQPYKHSFSPAPLDSISKGRSIAELPQRLIPTSTTKPTARSYTMQASGGRGPLIGNGASLYTTPALQLEIGLESEHCGSSNTIDDTEMDYPTGQSLYPSDFTSDMLSSLTSPVPGHHISPSHELVQRASVSNQSLAPMTQLLDHNMDWDPTAYHDYWYLLS